MTGIYCPDCKTDKHVPEYELDNLFVCSTCGKIIAYYCSRCEQMYRSNRLGLHGDVYECRICGKIQWGYTDYKRKKGEIN